jgi:hypothetical protein
MPGGDAQLRPAKDSVIRKRAALFSATFVLLVAALAIVPAANAIAGTLTWGTVAGAASPPGEIDAAEAFDPGTGNVILYGGLSSDDQTTVYDQTWEWNGSNWTQDAAASGPGQLQQASLADDPASSQLILFGGEANAQPNYSGLSNRTWQWTGSTWTQLAPATSPPLLSGAAMAYDPGSQDLVLYGGYNGLGTSDVADQTWLWNGTTWTQIPAAGGPPGGLAFANLAYDSSTGQLILYGGLTSPSKSSETGGTWVWSDATDTWTQLTPAASPGPLAAAALVNDPGFGLVLYGGRVNSTQISSQTWEWTGTTWVQLSPSVNPGGSTGLVALGGAYDPVTQNIVLYGGFNGTSGSGATWLGGSAAAVVAATPTITATLSSNQPPRAGWYRKRVTVNFTCNAGVGTLTTACPPPVLLIKSGRRSVTGTVTSSSGVVASIVVHVNIDSIAPQIKFSGTKRGRRTYRSPPKIRYSAHDTLSGVSSRKLTKHVRKTRRSEVIKYTATVKDRAGNVAVKRLTVTVRR